MNAIKMLYNGKIYQGEEKFCQALIIENDTIVGCGSNDEVEALVLKYENVEKTDLNGKCVVAGFNDSHMHLLKYSRQLKRVQLHDCKSKKEVIALCKKYIKDYPELVKEGLRGRGWNQDNFDDGQLLTKEDLDSISKDIPVVLVRVCGHMCCCNSKALEMLNFESEDGILTENDVNLTNNLFAENTEQLIQDFIEANKIALSCGVTSVQSQDIDDLNKEIDIITLLEETYHNNENLCRYHLQVGFDSVDSLTEALDKDIYKFNIQDDRLTMGPIKLFKDGSLGAKTALLYDGYIDDKNNKGLEVVTHKEMKEFVKIAEENSLQMIVHAIGDKAIDETCDAFISQMSKGNNLRHVVNHCQITSYEILKKITQNNILIAYQPIFLQYDLHMAKNRVKQQLLESSYAFKTALDYGIKCSLGTDCPVESLNPFYNIHCAVNRQDLDYQPESGYYPKECLIVTQAIDTYTIGSSYQQFMENRKGKLQKGYLADYVIIDDDIFTCDKKAIKNISVLETVIGGKTVYRK
ncbi:MAG TPA: amidohydrolase [Erysipelotrichaceae bacterium]|jgi:predicted amidohydrolase YtcJ|nr:amidohydrolase [Erysipelotrichaceae bacterium]HQA84958.1 amidohydrolase [Erysipelotrichaceae bacterium]